MGATALLQPPTKLVAVEAVAEVGRKAGPVQARRVVMEEFTAAVAAVAVPPATGRFPARAATGRVGSPSS